MKRWGTHTLPEQEYSSCCNRGSNGNENSKEDSTLAKEFRVFLRKSWFDYALKDGCGIHWWVVLGKGVHLGTQK